MDTVMAAVPVIPMRKEPAHRAEMISQLLFGEIAERIEDKDGFTWVKNTYDGYEGWCQSNQLLPITENNLETNNRQLTASWTDIVTLNQQPMHVSLGSPLQVFQNGKAELGNHHFTFQGNAWNLNGASPLEASIKHISFQFINTPYLWGGRSVFGIDCSGFVQQVFRFFNIPISRDAYQQAMEGEAIGFLQEAKCGDLAFFDNEEGRIIHVGLLYNADTIVHAAGKVRMDKIDNMGIVNTDTGERTHRLRIIKRYY
ncbi:MAG: hypothetical protein RLZZ28_1504 [Bacteroidota bacterium]|jgi:hypothetical protein